MPAFFAIAFSLRRKCPSGFPFPFGNTKSCGCAFRSRILSLIFQTSFAGTGMNLSLADFFFFLPLRRKWRQGFGCTYSVHFSQLKSAYSVFCISASRTPEFKNRPRQDFAGDENVPCPQECVQRLEDVVNRAIVQIAFMFS